MAAMTHGILFARANSSAPALCELKSRDAGPEGFPGWRVLGASPWLVTWRRDGDRSGDEKDRR